ncbi:hypothetical protein NQZ68_017721, partial [Dissostichus eleginoides]
MNLGLRDGGQPGRRLSVFGDIMSVQGCRRMAEEMPSTAEVTALARLKITES